MSFVKIGAVSCRTSILGVNEIRLPVYRKNVGHFESNGRPGEVFVLYVTE